MNACIIYSSCTGNTRKVAEAMAETSGIPCFAVRNAPAPDDFDLLALGFWVRKGQPDARAQRYMERVRGKHVFFFGTLGAWPTSDHARRCLAATHALIEAGGNMVVDGFLCQGKVNPQVIAASQRKGGAPHERRTSGPPARGRAAPGRRRSCGSAPALATQPAKVRGRPAHGVVARTAFRRLAVSPAIS